MKPARLFLQNWCKIYSEKCLTINATVIRLPHSDKESNSGDDSSVNDESSSRNDYNTSVHNDYDKPPKQNKTIKNNSGDKMSTHQNTN